MPKIHQSINEAKEAILNDIEKKIVKLIFSTHAHIVQNTPVDTGRLRSSIQVEKQGGDWIIGTNVPYAEHVELGVKPHVIKPVNKKALYWKGAKHPVKSVNHPGYDGYLMFQKGVDYFERELKNLE